MSDGKAHTIQDSKVSFVTLFLFVVHLFESWRLQAVGTNETDALTWRKCHLDTET